VFLWARIERIFVPYKMFADKALLLTVVGSFGAFLKSYCFQVLSSNSSLTLFTDPIEAF